MQRRTIAPRSSWSVPLFGETVYRRKAHVVVWDAEGHVTVTQWEPYWNPRQECTFVCLSRCGDEGLWLPLRYTFGTWHFLTGEVCGVKLMDGWGPDGCDRPMYEQVWPTGRCDPDNHMQYWASGRGRLMPSKYSTMAHT